MSRRREIRILLLQISCWAPWILLPPCLAKDSYLFLSAPFLSQTDVCLLTYIYNSIRSRLCERFLRGVFTCWLVIE